MFKIAALSSMLEPFLTLHYYYGLVFVCKWIHFSIIIIIAHHSFVHETSLNNYICS